ncbi:thioredoxin-dependent thiol peroxidase [Vibrio diabolicus]|jgi:peroxiredoxin Q/BCP|uniref:thioredoxin-dependent thiol peroxidase n=1 Tax=Vibrio diabolicus TaxID=50719 RepID=UPI00062BF2C9|nr:thioredoxin-dependent thiol peroxidase [Vibrio diabolicus]AVF57920.1 thioredoxin-dependent thiol peroxidase [Vibrio diabolicus]KAB0317671.1 thioredoxin-dependent thiol peroxidase [Vibrio diabolicus]UDY81953.1 thioredoxin-dependent thiol peroxidase [Vibrio diabolicus]
MNTLTAGSPAPAFSLLDQDGNTVSLEDFKGKKVLLYFYPRASTPGCTVQAQGLRDTKAELDSHNVVVLGVSPDTPKKLTNFINKQELNFTLLADEEHEVCEKYGVWQLKKFMGRENMGVVRTSFLIDESGNLEHVFNKFKTKDHHEVVLNYLNENA